MNMNEYNEHFDSQPATGLTEEEINSPEFNPDEFAPAPEIRGTAGGRNMRSSLFFTILCACAALLLALIGCITGSAAEKGAESLKEQEVLRLFENCDSARFYQEIDGCSVYAVYYKGMLAGYAAFVTEDGYLGPIDILIGVNSENRIAGIQVLSHSESEGLGSKITKNKFLSQFEGLTAGEIEPELISGATISSQAVKRGTVRVMNMGLSLLDIARELGTDVISSDEIQQDQDTEEENSGEDTDNNPSSSKDSSHGFDYNASTQAPDEPALDGSQIGGNNINIGGGSNSADGQDVTTVYDTETEPTDETSAETPDESAPPAPVDTQAPVVTTAPPPVTAAPPVVTTAPPVSTDEPDDTEDQTDPVDPEETTGPESSEEPSPDTPEEE